MGRRTPAALFFGVTSDAPDSKVNLFAVSDPMSIYQQTLDLEDVVKCPGEPLNSRYFVAYDRAYDVAYMHITVHNPSQLL